MSALGGKMTSENPFQSRRLLVVDDDGLFSDAIARYFHDRRSLEVVTAHTGRDALTECAQATMDVVVLDQKLPDGPGAQLCPQILAHNDQTKIIFVTAYPSFRNAQEAVRLGAHDYLAKPFELDELELSIDRALSFQNLERVDEVQRYRSSKEIKEAVVIGESAPMKEILRLAKFAASVDTPILITGRTGTGKTLLAKRIHYESALRSGPFISVNCAAIPENLMESELFGHEKGAFTGALSARKGVMELAQGGTLLLDEVGEMPPHLQSKLLSVVDEKRFKRVGAERFKELKARIIAATNVNVEDAMLEGRFRSDLYYRLSVLRIHLPDLKDRKEDIPLLAARFLETLGPRRRPKLGDDVMARLLLHDWPGNVRELYNALERMALLGGTDHIPTRETNSAPLAPALSEIKNHRETRPASDGPIIPLADIERRHILRSLELCGGNLTKTAHALGISLSTLQRRVRSYGAQGSSRPIRHFDMSD
jgi:DNA-binding NtrC family response regulator